MQSYTRLTLKGNVARTRYDDTIKGQHALQLIPQFESGMRELYWMHGVLVKALPKMIWFTQTEALTGHLVSFAHTSQNHLIRMESIFRMMRKKAIGTKSMVADALVREAIGDLERAGNSFLRDARIVFSVQKIFQYEIAAFGKFLQIAENLGLHEIADLLHASLEEVQNASDRLKEISMAISYHGAENIAG
jgi:ferritin-like metal-binding protein YciE